MAGQAENHPNAPIFLFIGILLLYFILIYLFGDELKQLHLWLREAIIVSANFVLPGDPFEPAIRAITVYLPEEWERPELSAMSQDVRWVLMVLYGAPLGYLIFQVYTKLPGAKLKRKMGRDELNTSEVRKWPWIAPVIKLDLINKPVDEGEWAMGMRYIEFCQTYKLFKQNSNELDELKAEKLMASQLGKLWQGPERLPDYAKALFACFVAQVATRDANVALPHLKAMARGFGSGSVSFAFADNLLEEYYDHPAVQKVVSRHAYASTVLPAMWNAASAIKAIPPNYFIWLRPLDRTLFYSLNCAGRRVPWPEVAAIYGHMLAERVAEHPLERPYVIKAVQALKRSLLEIEFDFTQVEAQWDPWDWSVETRLKREGVIDDHRSSFGGEE